MPSSFRICRMRGTWCSHDSSSRWPPRYYRSRYYDGSRGRFTSRDPMGYAAGPSLYEYVASRPLNNVDPTGLEGDEEEEQIIDDAYRLEVSSPGLDHPIVLLRQYVKNIGRNVRVTTIEETKHEGILAAANDKDITIEEETGKGSKKVINELIFSLDQIKKTEILVKF